MMSPNVTMKIRGVDYTLVRSFNKGNLDYKEVVVRTHVFRETKCINEYPIHNPYRNDTQEFDVKPNE
jgi:hypothetical protein